MNAGGVVGSIEGVSGISSWPGGFGTTVRFCGRSGGGGPLDVLRTLIAEM